MLFNIRVKAPRCKIHFFFFNNYVIDLKRF